VAKCHCYEAGLLGASRRALIFRLRQLAYSFLFTAYTAYYRYCFDLPRFVHVQLALSGLNIQVMIRW
jgi:hypothetical protein